MKLKTVYIFVPLIVGSWFVEIFFGVFLVRWYWGTLWQNEPGHVSSFAETAVSDLQLFSSRFAQLRPASFLLGCVGVYLGVHLVFVLVSLFRPCMRRWKLGARRPSMREEERFSIIFSSFAQYGVRRPTRWMVVDGLGMQIRWIGYVLVVDRELIAHRFFPALLAHHLCHANSEDRIAHRLYVMLPFPFLVGAMVSGLPIGIGHLFFYPVWAWYWRERIFAADVFAVELGQGEALVHALDELYLKLDQSTRGARFLRPVPYVEMRIDRLKRLQGQGQNTVLHII